jgi:hypothetical protein
MRQIELWVEFSVGSAGNFIRLITMPRFGSAVERVHSVLIRLMSSKSFGKTSKMRETRRPAPKFKRRFPERGDAFLTWQGSGDTCINLAYVLKSKRYPYGEKGGKIHYVYWDVEEKKLEFGIQSGAIEDNYKICLHSSDML